MKRKINLHQRKVWAILYPLYATVAIYGTYEDLADAISLSFELTPEQWDSVLSEWEFLRNTILTTV